MMELEGESEESRRQGAGELWAAPLTPNVLKIVCERGSLLKTLSTGTARPISDRLVEQPLSNRLLLAFLVKTFALAADTPDFRQLRPGNVERQALRDHDIYVPRLFPLAASCREHYNVKDVAGHGRRGPGGISGRHQSRVRVCSPLPQRWFPSRNAAAWRRWLVGDFVEVILGVKDVAGCGCGETRHSIRGCKPPPVCRFYRLLEVARVSSVHAAVWRRWLVGDLVEVILVRWRLGRWRLEEELAQRSEGEEHLELL